MDAPEFDDTTAWVESHLGHLTCDGVTPSKRFRGGQTAADDALAAYSVGGYAKQRNQAFPPEDRGASGLSPYIRHGLLPLRRVWDHVEGGPSADVRKFRDELLWQEYARHLYARVGGANAGWIRFAVEPARTWPHEPWWREMACIDAVTDELLTDGWMVNQTRMWMASQWTVRAGARWQVGEDAFFRHLLDGSRAANRLGWLWTIGGGTGKAYGFSRWQVQKRAPGMCDRCSLRDDCPIQSRPETPSIRRVGEARGLRTDPDPDETAGPSEPTGNGRPDVVWLTAESLGDADPALEAHPDLPVLFVFDEPLLERLRLSGKRLVFLAETLADLARRRTVEVEIGPPVEALSGRSVAVTFAPVPGFRRISQRVEPSRLYPWPWLRRPSGVSAVSFSQWVRAGRPE
ncbi:MAG: FAD-binding domain-containing protein, partial [Acidimicrobiia bacterium]|nr:FAD-binding domain-containing protein [Acidimicrobiia bacterium]